jgi:hypothetical protein
MFVVFGDKDRDYIIIDMISLSLGLCLLFWGSMIISGISPYDDFYFYVLYVIIGFM